MRPGFRGDPTNKQQVFNFVVNFLRLQGKAAADEAGSCKYRTADGLCCAAGCLIFDEDYQPAWEGTAVAAFAGTPNDVTAYFANRGFNMPLLRELQNAHDQSSGNKFDVLFTRYAMRSAREHQLTMPKRPGVFRRLLLKVWK